MDDRSARLVAVERSISHVNSTLDALQADASYVARHMHQSLSLGTVGGTVTGFSRVCPLSGNVAVSAASPVSAGVESPSGSDSSEPRSESEVASVGSAQGLGVGNQEGGYHRGVTRSAFAAGFLAHAERLTERLRASIRQTQ